MRVGCKNEGEGGWPHSRRSRPRKLIFLTFDTSRIEYCPLSGKFIAIVPCLKWRKPCQPETDSLQFRIQSRSRAREGTYAQTTFVLRSFDSYSQCRNGAKSTCAGPNGTGSNTARAGATAGEARLGVGDTATGCRGAGADGGECARACGAKARVHRGSCCASASARGARDAG